jgi:hypothetical protein
MPLRVNPIILLGLVITLILSFGIFASAQLGGGTAGDAISVGEAQMGKPWQMATDGPSTFSCAGLMRYIMRTIGVDGDAPWVPEGFLSKYAAVDPANLQPGDIVIYPDWATMYVGNGMVLNSNEALGYVTETPMSEAGTPEGMVRPPYGGQSSQGDALQSPTQPLAGATQYRATQPQSGALDPQPQSGALDPPPTQPLAGATQYGAQQPLDAAPVQPLAGTMQYGAQQPQDVAPVQQPLAGATQYGA